MTTKILYLLVLVAYAVIVSQSFMYMLSLKQVQMKLGADNYTEVRQLTDTSMRSSFKYVIYVALAATILLLVVTSKQPAGVAFITSAIAFLALVAEILLTLRGSLPVNDIINSWSPGHIPADWQAVRDRWFSIYQYRQVATITGFISLVAGLVWRMK